MQPSLSNIFVQRPHTANIWQKYRTRYPKLALSPRNKHRTSHLVMVQ